MPENPDGPRYSPLIESEIKHQRMMRALRGTQTPNDLGVQNAEPPARHSPAWERLKIITQHGGNDIAQLDGKEHRITSPAATFLKALQEKQGKMILGTDLKSACGERADRIYKTLPFELQSIIDKPCKGKQGYRML